MLTFAAIALQMAGRQGLTTSASVATGQCMVGQASTSDTEVASP